MFHYPFPQLLFEQRIDNRPDHVEDKRLVDDVHLFEPQRHGVLSERQQPEDGAGTVGHHVLHRHPLQVEHYDDPPYLGLGLQHGAEMEEIEHPEHLVGRHFIWIPIAYKRDVNMHHLKCHLKKKTVKTTSTSKPNKGIEIIIGWKEIWRKGIDMKTKTWNFTGYHQWTIQDQLKNTCEMKHELKE